MNRVAEGQSSRRGPIDWVFSLFADVRGGEGLTALLLMVNAFLLLSAYYIIKPLREALILGGAGAEVKSYSSAAQAVLLLFLIPAYGRLGSRVNRIRLITWVTMFFISNLAIFYALGLAGVQGLGIPFFLWVGIFNVMIIAQFWAFANDVYTPDQGKRLFALVAIGSSLGGILGAWVAKPLIEAIGVFQPMLLAGAMLGVSLLLTRAVHNRVRVARDVGGKPVDEKAVLAPAGGFQLVFKTRYLLLVAFLILLLNAVNTTGEYILGKTVETHVEQTMAASGVTGAAAEEMEGKEIGKFYADFFFWVNMISFLAQAFLVSRIMQWFGIRVALFVLPLIALGGYALLAISPVLAYIRTVKIAENATDYSLNNTVRHALFLPTSREAKYKAKAAIDSFFWRMGDLASAGLVFIGTQMNLDIRRFAAVNLGFVVLWLLIVIGIVIEHRKLVGDERAPAPDGAAAQA